MSAALRAAREAFPEVEVADALAAPALSAALAAGPLDPRRAGELYLCAASIAHDPIALRILDQRYLSLVGNYLARIDPSAAFADDVRQRLREKLLLGPQPKLAGFTGRGSLEAWMRAAAVRTGLTLRRDRGLVASASQADGELPMATDPELKALGERYRAECTEAFRLAIAGLESRQRTLLRLHYLEGMSIDALGPAYQVHRATAARWVAAARTQLLEGTRRELSRLLGGAGLDTVDGLLALVQSQFQVNLRSTIS